MSRGSKTLNPFCIFCRNDDSAPKIMQFLKRKLGCSKDSMEHKSLQVYNSERHEE